MNVRTVLTEISAMMKHRKSQLAAVNNSAQRLKVLVHEKKEMITEFMDEIRGK